MYSEYQKKEITGLCPDCIDALRKEEKLKDTQENTGKYMKLYGFPSRFIEWEKERLIPKLQKLLGRCLTEKGLFLTGTRGSGKTCFASVLGKELIRRGDIVWFKNVTDLLFEIKGTFDKEGKIFNDYEMICRWAAKPILVLDDLGAEKVSEYVRQSLYALINKRYLDDLPTIVTSNLTLDEVAGRLDDRIASRLTEMCQVVTLGDKDLRVYTGAK
jgi:DNA replication protein DnaC